MAGSITVAAAAIGGNITRYTVTWLSDASGDVSANSFPVEAGHLMQVRQIPNAAGTQPTDQYDVTVLDANSFDVLVGGGANVSNAAASYITPVLTTGYPIFVEAGNLTPVIASAGNAKGGQIVFYVSPGDSLRLGTAVTLDASDATLTKVASVSGSTTTGNLAKFADTAGTVTDASISAAANFAYLDVAQSFTKPQRVAKSTVTIATLTFTPDLNVSNHFVLTLAHSASNVLANPSNIASAVGQSGIIEIIQSSTGSDAIGTFGTQWIAPGGAAAIALSAGASAQDYFLYYVVDATHILLTPLALAASH